MDLHEAILQADFQRIRDLIESGAAVNSKDKEQRTPLILCCLHDGESWALGVGRMLLVHGASVGLCDSRGRSALIYAVLYERFGLTKLFLQALDFNLNHMDKYGHTALYYATQNGSRSIYDLVLQNVKKYHLKMPVFPATAGSCFGSHEEQGLDRHQRAVNQNIRDCSSNNEVKEHPCAQPKKNVPPLFRRNLPYPPLPTNLWAKRENLYKRLRPSKEKPDRKTDLNRNLRMGMWEKKPGGAGVIPSLPEDWKLDMRTLMEALQDQISPSYRSPAQPCPPTVQPRRRAFRLGPSPNMGVLLCQHRRTGRRMSLDAAGDQLLKERKPVGALRRRCSVAVIPLIRLGGHSQRDGATKMEAKGQGEMRRRRGSLPEHC